VILVEIVGLDFCFFVEIIWGCFGSGGVVLFFWFYRTLEIDLLVCVF